MPLSVSSYSATLLASLQLQGYNGYKLSSFCTAVGTGVINTITTTTGQILVPINSGISSGIGIVVSNTNIGTNIRNTAISLFGQEGTELIYFSNIIGNITQSQLALATLTSDTNGTASFNIFLSKINIMASAIQAAAPDFAGLKWPDFCTAIATGICNELGNSGSGVLVGAALIPPGTGVVLIS
jgi:hypothetical protein